MAWGLVIVWFVSSNAYFGWSWRPQSDAEMICDGIAFVLLALALLRS